MPEPSDPVDDGAAPATDDPVGLDVDVEAEPASPDDADSGVSAEPRDRTRRPAPRRRFSRLTPRRWLPFIAFVGVIAAVVVGTGDETTGDSTRAVSTPGEMIPVAAPDDALSTAFFCPGGTARGDGPVELSATITNAREVGTTAEIAIVGDEGQSARFSVDVPAHGSVGAVASEHVDARWAAMTVEVMGGGVSVEQRVEGPLGFDSAPCPTVPSDTWYIPSGSTAIGATQQILLYNPLPAPAIVSVDFTTDAGSTSPRDLRSVTVAGRSLRVLGTEDLPPRRDQIATTVRSRSGQIIVGRVQRFDGTGSDIPAERESPSIAPQEGLAATSAIPAPSTRWVFPNVRNGADVRNAVAIHNPGEEDAEISLWPFYENRALNAEIEPIAVTVRAGRQMVVDLRDRPGLDDGLSYGIILDSFATDSAAVPVVAELLVDNGVEAPPQIIIEGEDEEGGDPEGEEAPDGTSPDGDERPPESPPEDAEDDERPPESPPEEAEQDDDSDDSGPLSASGYTVVAGSPVTSTDWLLTGMGDPEATMTEVVVINPTSEPVEVTVETIRMGARERLGGAVSIPAGDRRTLDLGEVPEGTGLRITSGGGAIVVGRTEIAIDGEGLGSALASPIPGTVRTLPPVPFS